MDKVRGRSGQRRRGGVGMGLEAWMDLISIILVAILLAQIVDLVVTCPYWRQPPCPCKADRTDQLQERVEALEAASKQHAGEAE